MPVIVAGLRTAAVWVVGTATLSTPVGATSLGNFIFSGLQTRNHVAVGVGCAAAAALALLLDQSIRALEAGLRDGRRALVGGALGILAGLCAWAAVSFAAPATGLSSRAIVIGAKTFTEQYVLSELLAARIADATGLPTRTLPSLGSTVAFDALRSNEIDVYVEYSGTVWATLMQRTQLPEDRSRVLAEVREFLRSEHAIEVAAALGFENTYALGMRADHARRLGIERISQLAPHAPQLEIGGDYEFFQRPEWTALQRLYGLAFRAERSMDSSLMYQAVAQGEVDVITAFSTDGRIAAQDIALLEDDRGAIPPYDALVLVGPRVGARAAAGARRARGPRRHARRRPDAPHEPRRRSGRPPPGRGRPRVPPRSPGTLSPEREWTQRSIRVTRSRLRNPGSSSEVDEGGVPMPRSLAALRLCVVTISLLAAPASAAPSFQWLRRSARGARVPDNHAYSLGGGVSPDGSVPVGVGWPLGTTPGPEAYRWQGDVPTPMGDLGGGEFSSAAKAASSVRKRHRRHRGRLPLGARASVRQAAA